VVLLSGSGIPFCSRRGCSMLLKVRTKIYVEFVPHFFDQLYKSVTSILLVMLSEHFEPSEKLLSYSTNFSVI